MTDRPGYSFDPGPPPEVATFFRNKGLTPSVSFQDVEPQEHAVAFTVAKMAQGDMLAAAKAEVQRAIDEGQSFEQFKRAWRGNPRLAEWWGQERRTDPVTGEESLVQLGSPRRLRTIYRANLRSARAAGQWERIERSKDALPFLEYRLGPSERHRPAHAAKEGTVRPVDDPFWARWMPPNGWGCKCWVRQITRRAAERLGISPPPEMDMREVINPRTGEAKMVPVGLDPSWDRNPGRQRLEAMERLLDGQLAEATEAEARAALRDMASSWMVRRVLRGRAGGRVSIGVVPPDLGATVGTTARFAKVTDEYGAKMGSKAVPVAPEVMADISDALAEGPLYVEERGTRADLIALVNSGGDLFEVVWKVLPDEVWLTTAHRTDPEKWRNRVERRGRRQVRE